MLRFHWRLLQAGEAEGFGPQRTGPEAALPDLAAQIRFCRCAEEHGIDSLLVDINLGKPDPMPLALALATATERVVFMVAHRPGLVSPTLFVQQVNTFSALAGGRISLNIVAGHSPQEQRAYGDFLTHDERYERMAEFLAICHALWERSAPVTFRGKYFDVEGARLNTPFVAPGRRAPEIYVGGSSPQAREVAGRRASCWMRFADTPEKLQEEIGAQVANGVEVGLRLSVLVRPTRDEALAAAASLLAALGAASRRSSEESFVRGSDSVSMAATLELARRDWLAPCLWAGAVPYHGATSLALVGAPDEVAEALLEYGRAGVTQFILSGWPKMEEMVRFGTEVLPRIRAAERLAGEPQEPEIVRELRE